MSSHILEATPVSELALPEVRKDGNASKSVISYSPSKRGVPVLIVDACVQYAGTRTPGWEMYSGLATAAGYDPVRGPGSSCLAPGASRICVLPWGSGTKEIMALVFATIGPAADYRTFGRWLILVSTAICWAAQFASMTLTSPSRWGAAMALNIISFASQGIVTSFFSAIFPQLARNTPHSRELRVRHERGELSLEAYEKEKSIEKSKISSVGMACFFLGQVFALPLNLSLLLPLSDNPKVDNYVIVLSTGYWVLFGIWWFIFQQPRPGPKLPKGGSYLTAGWRQIFVALKQYKKLPNTFAYLFSSFLLSDQTYLTLVRVVTCGASVIASWYIQRHWKLDIKTMIGGLVSYGFTILGSSGCTTVMFGLAVGPNYAISQTMMCELSPPGFEYMAIINKHGNNWKAFPLLAVLIALACIVAVFWIDVPKGRSAAVQWATEQRSTSDYEVYSDGKDSESSKSEGKSKGNI
ncbi:MFS general substrate transporter [Lactarius hengduanensis]|nr:MFS general substrate transporter [Lactarius hengduanensis]